MSKRFTETPYFQPLPERGVILHPSMGVELGGYIVHFCEQIGVSIWDREVIYKAVTQLPKEER